MDFDLVLIVIFLLLSAFFSGMEIAYISSNKIYIELEKKQKGILAKILTKLTLKPSKFIATMLIGNNIALVIYGFYMGDFLVSWFQSLLPSEHAVVNYLLIELSLLTQTLLSTGVILLTAEFFPKVFFQIYANVCMKLFAIPAYIFYVIFSFISDFIIWISDMVLKYIFKTEGDRVKLEFTKVELGHYINEQIEAVDDKETLDSEIQIFQNALEFPEIKSREVMVPRTEIVAVEVRDKISDVSELFSESGYSKILVYNSSIDDILGYVRLFDLFKKPKTIKSIIKPIEYVPETMLAKDVLNVLTKKRKSIAVVLDEYGGTSGIMTVEDIVEELFGEIEDEHDSIALIEDKLDENTFKLSARIEVDYLNTTYNLNLPESENYETLGGLIVNSAEQIPQQGDNIKIEHYNFEIFEASTTKIDVVILKILDQE